MSLDPSSRDIRDYPELEEVTVGSFTPVVGLNADFKIKAMSNAGGYAPVRLRFEYGMPTKLDGNIFSVTLGISFIARPLKRK
jgi:hypothetical protein